MGERRTVYLAGPDVFLPDAREIGARKKRLCTQYGFDGLFPFDNEAPADGGDADLRIYRANVAMLRRADCGIFNLTPFRGPSADVGTVFEMGLLAGLGKPGFGYSNDPCTLLERMRREGLAIFDARASRWVDAAGMAIEDFGAADNLMIDACLRDGGRPLVRHDAPERARFSDLAGFERCLELAREFFAGGTPPDGSV